ncbi:hypothetical protein JW877_01435 [bacterium]|nr:hypothetical protein [bacterium]
MNKITFIFITVVLLSAFGLIAQVLNPPHSLNTVSNLDGHVPLSWMEPLPPRDIVELFYDDGFAHSSDSTEAYDRMSVRFTPLETCSLITARFFMFFIGGDHSVQIRVWEDNGYGRPDYGGALCPPINLNTSVAYDWLEVDLTPYHLTFSPGEDFHISIEKRDTIFYPFYFLLADSEAVTPRRSYVFDVSELGFYPSDGDFMIRAMVVPYEPTGFLRASGTRIVHSLPLDDSQPYKLVPLPAEWGALPPRQFAFHEVTGYRIYKNDSPSVPFDLAHITTSLNYDDYAVDNGRTYYYYVTATYPEGESEPCEIASGIPRGGDITTYLDTLKYDHDSATAAVSWRPGARSSVKFELDKPCRLRQLHYRFYHIGRFYPGVFEWDGEQPGDPIFVYPFSREITTIGWHNENVSGLNILLYDDFVVSCGFADAFLSISLERNMDADWSWDYNSGIWHNVSDTAYYIRAVIQYNSNEEYVHLAEGWNMISFTVLPEETGIEELLPFIIPPAYYYDSDLGRYVGEDDITPGRGYFVFNAAGDTSLILTGTPITGFDIECQRGWNLIGSLSSFNPVPISSALTYPAGAIRIERTYYYDTETRSYFSDTLFHPGKAHWVLFNPECIFRLELE